MSRKKPRKDRSRGKEKPSPLRQQLREAIGLIRQGYLLDAARLLEKLDRPHPEQAAVLAHRIELVALLRDLPLAHELAERLVALRPKDPEAHLRLAGVCMLAMVPGLALPAFRRALELQPDGPEAQRTLASIAQCEAAIRQMAVGTGLEGPDLMRAWAEHEQAQVHLQRNEFERALAVSDELLRSHPRCAAAWNNAALALFQLGDLPGALTRVQTVLSFEPDNLHALAGAARYQLLLGQPAEALETARRLKAIPVRRDDGWLKIAETLAYLGDDEGVLEAAGEGRKSPVCQGGVYGALLEHLAAVALYRQGNEAAARRCWERSLKLDPQFENSRAHLEELRRSVGKRNAAWPFALPYWLPPPIYKELADRLAVIGTRSMRQGEARAEVIAFLERHPEVEALMPCLLDRGDPQGRGWALSVCGIARTPSLLAALRDFALSQRGPDDLRHEAARVADEAGLIPSGPVRMWMGGEWREVRFFNFEITDEPEKKHSDEVTELLTEAWEALMANEPARAEPLLRQALELEPDAPDTMNNLAQSLQNQGKRAEADELMRQIDDRHPDYFFGMAARARRAVKEGRLDEAGELIKAMQGRSKLHTSEFTVLAITGIEYALARNQPAGAQYWMQMWEKLVPGHPNQPAIRRLIRDHGVRGHFPEFDY
jgi:tetratricopeptide (TPR) repeat protein